MFEQKKAPEVKRPYVSPVIKVYGNIRTITQNVGPNGKNDNSNSSLKSRL